MICPKCGGQSVFPAMNEAPDGARDWRKCLSCGKRWDPTTAEALATVAQAFEEWQPDEDEDAGASQDEDSVDGEELSDLDGEDEPLPTLAMRDVRVRRVTQKEGGMAIGGRCTARGCTDDAAEDSVKCARHRDIQREKNEKYQGRSIPVKPGRKAPRAAVVSVPAKREPETLPTPRPVGQRGDVLIILDSAIVSAHADVQAIERTREILSRQS